MAGLMTAVASRSKIEFDRAIGTLMTCGTLTVAANTDEARRAREMIIIEVDEVRKKSEINQI